jgi:selenocysteine-specific elongation factor
MEIGELAKKANLSPEEAAKLVAELVSQGQVVEVPGGEPAYYSMEAWSALKRKLQEALEAYHRERPLRRGMSREEARSRLGLSNSLAPRIFALLVQEGSLAEEEAFIRLPTHRPHMTAEQQRQADEYVRALEVEPFSPPTDRKLEPELLAALVDDGRVVKVNEEVVFAATAYKQMMERIVELARKQGKVSVADVRTLFNSSRKYVLPLLEYLDSQRVTRRVGDERVLRQAPGSDRGQAPSLERGQG